MIFKAMIVRGTKSWMILDVLNLDLRSHPSGRLYKGQQMSIAVTVTITVLSVLL